MRVHILVLAKEPVAGKSKTRLSPPCSPAQAASVARAALLDTLATVAATPALSRIVVLDGRPGEWLPEGFDVVVQRGAGLAERLAASFEDCPAPALLIGMDTPQLTPEHLSAGSALLMSPRVDSVLGSTYDGGYWAIGLRKKSPGVFNGVPMSTGRTGVAQLGRLDDLGLACASLPPQRDIDYWGDALDVARSIPGSRLARTVTRIEQDLAKASV